MTEYALGALAVISLANGVLVFRVARSLRSIERLEARAARLTDAVGLLTDTTESGFRALGDRLPAGDRRTGARAPRASSVRAATARMVRSAQRGTPAAEIAAREEVAEGEVRLRLQLADAGAAEAQAPAPDAIAAS